MPLLVLSFFSSFFEKENVKPQENRQSQTNEQDGIVFIDISKSMRGYFCSKCSNIQGNALQNILQKEFHNFMSENNLRPLYVAKFASEFATPEEMQGNIGNMFVFDSDDKIKEFFSGNKSNLIQVFESKAFSEHRVSIIITDGILSGEGGFDVGKLIKVVKEKNESGLQIYLIGIMSEFDGLVFPVLPGHTKRFWHKGLKPVYIWIIGRDSKIGSDIANYITSKVKINNLNEEYVKTVYITKEYLPYVNNLEFIPDSSKEFKVIHSGKDIKILLSSSLRTSKKEEIDIPIKITTNISDMQKYWKITMRLKQEIKWTRINENEDGFFLSLKYDSIPDGSMFGSGGGEFELKIMAIPDPERFWWRKWNTDNDLTEENADKTLYLERLGKQLIEPLYNKEYELKSLHIKIEKL